MCLQTHPGKGENNKEAREALKKTEELGKDNNAIVFYQNEVHFQVTASITRKWVPKSSTPQGKFVPGRKSVDYSGYVVPSTGELFVSRSSWFNFETAIQSFWDFIKRYPTQKRIFLVMDNSPLYKKVARLVQSEALEGYPG